MSAGDGSLVDRLLRMPGLTGALATVSILLALALSLGYGPRRPRER
ncbi:MAG: hypothetical protein MAG715_00233 [Methanonatronarchaeales archaeon]|nr:hypothetical protein [Methanonatronarchaeales archaeon]